MVFGQGTSHGRKQDKKNREQRRRRLARLMSRRPQVETLESRQLLAVDFSFDYSTNAPSVGFLDATNGAARQAALEQAADTFNATASGPGDDELIVVGDVGADEFTVQFTGPGTGVILRPGLPPLPFQSVETLIIDGGDGDDHLILDLNNFPLPAGGIVFNGGGQDNSAGGDTLTILNSAAPAGQQILDYTTVGPDGKNGTIQLDSGPLITYTGLEPINAGNAADTILNLPITVANDATLQDSFNAGEIEIIDNGATFENTVIPNPSNSLTVNLGNAGDFLTVTTLDFGYQASLIINGGTSGADEVQLTDVDLGTVGRGLWVTETETLGVTGGLISFNTAPIGAGILIDNSANGTTATLDGVVIQDNIATGAAANQGGGGIFNNGAELIILNGSLISFNVANGTLGSGGGIFNGLGGDLFVEDSFIEFNDAERAGGGIEDASNNSVVLSNASLSFNSALGTDVSAPGNGGGLHVTGNATVGIDLGNVSNNFAAREGGGLWNGGGLMQIDGATIDGNTASGDAADDGGGGIFNQGGFVEIGFFDPVDIVNNVADGAAGSGGGIFNNAATGFINMVGGSVSDNLANRAGGGIEDASGPGLGIDLFDVALDNNVANGGPGNGGGLHVTDDGDVSIILGTVNGNSAAAEGGGLWNGGGVMTIDGTTIDGNTASGNASDEGGGGIFNNGGEIRIDPFAFPVSITNNVANGTAGSGGGIFNNTGGTLDLGDNSVIITGNVAQRAGGGIEHASATPLVLNGITLDNNSAQAAPGNGGGLHITGGADSFIIGGTVNGNSAAAEGGGLWNGGGTMTIDGTTIDGNTASGAASDQGGGGIFSAGGELLIGLGAAVDITNNVADGAAGSGGGILNDGGSTDVFGGNITGNSAIRAGGGIEIVTTTGPSLLLGGVNLSNNTALGGTAPGNGGGLHVTGGGDVDIDASFIVGNSAALEGGGLWNGGGVMTIDGTTINGNTASGDAADDGGGGIFNQAGVLEIGLMTPSNITNNVADGDLGSGGGFFLNSGSSVVMDGGAIDGNTANRAGGGIEDASGTGLGITLTNVLLINNSAIGGGVPGSPGNGGGIHVTGDSDVNITDGVIDNNSAALEGGGLWNGTGTMTVLRTPVVDNTASGAGADDGGGGIFNSGGTVDLDALIIIGNVANGASGSGGGILNLGGTITVDNVLIDANTASRAGGGIEDRDGSSIDITNSMIRENNTGTSPGNGGGIHITGTGTVNIDGSTIHNNTAVEGGGLWNSGSGTFTLTNSTISGNSATGSDGGGIFNTSGGTVTTDSVTITLNVGAGTGDGVAGGTSGVTLENTIVAQNPGGGTEENLSGSINSDDFNLIGDPDNGTLTGLTVNTIFGGDALLLPLLDTGGPFIPALGGAAPTHLPGAGSPAIGFGVTTLLVDQRDVQRPQGSQDDIGAVEADLDGFVVTANDSPLVGQAGDGNADEFRIINDAGGITGNVEVYVNSRLLTQTFPKATTGLIVIRGSADDDTLIIDNSNGLIGTRIVFDGDGTGGTAAFPTPGGFDTLILHGSTPVTTTYNPGETNDAGAVFQENNQIVQAVEFFGLEPIQVLAPVGGNNVLNVASAPLGVGFPQALNAANSINYTEGPNSDDPVDPVFAGALTGLITVDGFESLEFANFEVLNIDAGAGVDNININNEVRPDELGTINVDGGDASATDTLIVDGQAGVLDPLVVRPTAQGQGTVDYIINNLPDVNYVNTETIELVGQAVDGDAFGVDGTAGSDLFVYNTGATPFVGSVEGTMGLGFSLPTINFQGMSTTTVLNTFGAQGGTDTVLFVATDLPDFIEFTGGFLDHFVAGNPIGSLDVGTAATGGTTTEIGIQAGDGSDTIEVTPDVGVTVAAIGGQPDSGSDTLNFIGTGNGAVTLDLTDQTITEAGMGVVSYIDIETVNIVANNDLTVNGGAANDTINVTPTAAGDEGTFDHNRSVGVLFSYSDAATVAFNGALGENQLNILGDVAGDSITSPGGAVVDVDGSSVTVGGGFDSVHVLGLGSGDVIDLSALVIASALTISGGDGPDQITGTAQNDIILGGAGDDVIFGLAGNDVIDGGTGNDIGTGGTGSDSFLGGDDSDTFVWNQGDGSDLIEGGAGASDTVIFNGNAAAADTITLSDLGSRLQLDRVEGPVNLNMADIENLTVNELGGGVGTITVNDLSATSLASLNLDLGAADGTVDAVTINATDAADNIGVTETGDVVSIDGLSHAINITNANSADVDTLTLNLGAGDDVAFVAASVMQEFLTTTNGGGGNDTLSGYNILSGDAGDDTLTGGNGAETLNGGPGNDLLMGAGGDDTINGGSGEDTMIGGAGNDTLDGGADFDTILIAGTSAADVIDVFQSAPTTLVHTVNGTTETDTLVVSTVEQAHVVAGDGADLIRVNWQDALGVNAAADSLRISVDGGSDATSDRLIVVDDGTDDLVLYRKAQADGSGTVQIGPGNAEPLLSVFNSVENIDFVDNNGVAINNENGPQLVVFKHDPLESNDDRFTSTYLGSGDVINVDPTIDPGPLVNPFGDGQNFGGDRDYYRVVAEATGTLDFQVYFRQVSTLASGRPGLPSDGNLDINVRDAAGNIIAGFGVNDATDDERVRIPAVEGETYFLEVFGNGDAINIYNFSIVNDAPPVPFDLELLDNPADGTTNPPGTSTNSDTGRSQFDNVTYDDTPTLYFRLDDGIFLNDLPGNPVAATPPDEIIPIPFQGGVGINLTQPGQSGYAIAIFDEGDTLPQTGSAPQTPLGFATLVGDTNNNGIQDGGEVIDFGVYAFTVPDGLALSEGSHFLSARVQMIDPGNPLQTGFGNRSESLEIIVDRTAPEVVFGLAADATDGLHADSDSGDPAILETLIDRITNDETPTFFGRAEANSIIRLYVDMDSSGTLTAADLLIGQTTATPLSGTEQLETPLQPLEPGGQWEITSTANLNDPAIVAALGLPKDGLRTILLSAEDVSGNITAADANVTLDIIVDTQGPQVSAVFISDAPAFDIFTLKPDAPEPTPRVDSLTIAIEDLPDRVAAFLYPAVSNVPPLAPIVLIGDHSGPIAINSLNYVPLNDGPGTATGQIVIGFASPLPDDRYTLTLSDNIIDPAGNQLDGENNAAEPIGSPFFPTGDAIPGGDFIARFTIDSRPEFAVWSQGVVYADINGNFVWDPEGQDNDATNRDFVYNFGEITDAYFNGNFASGANSSGFDKLGAYGRFNGVYQFFLDTDDDGIGDLVPNMAFQVNAIPVAGNFSGPAGNAVPAGERPRDEIGAYDGQFWYLDTNGNNQIDNNERLATSMQGIPFVGDFNGDGFDDLAVYNNEDGQFQFDLNRDGNADDSITFGFPGFGEKPVAGDFNLDGIDDIGLWVPGREGQLPKDAGEFHFLLSDNDPIGNPLAAPVLAPGLNAIFEPFSPAPLGNDLVAQFGDDFALPLWGNFDPPIAQGDGGATFRGSLTNELNPFDTNRSGQVTAADALVVINALANEELNNFSVPLRAVAALDGFQLDANRSGAITAGDALVVINHLAVLLAQSEAPEAEQAIWSDAVASVFAAADADDDDWLAILAADEDAQRGTF